MMAAERKHIPYVVTLHTGGHSSDFRQRLRSVQWRALGPLLRGAAVVVAVSRFEQKMFDNSKWAMAYVCPRGVGPTAWIGSEKQQTQRLRRFYLLGD
jgi:hypothetical protein